jgi:hypothetical protein
VVSDVDLKGSTLETEAGADRLVVEFRVSEANLWRSVAIAAGLLLLGGVVILTGGAALVLAGSVVAGAGLTYLFALPLTLEERLAFGTVVGAMAFTVGLLVLAVAFGLSLATVLVALAASLAVGAAGWWRGGPGLAEEWTAFASRAPRLWPLWVLLGVSWPFTLHMLAQAYAFTPAGLVVGQQAVYGDWALHLQYAGSFAFGHNFPPEYPIDPGHRLGYPFMVDLFAAGLVPLGTSLTSSLVYTSGLLALAFPAVMYLAALRFTASPVAAALAVAVFLLSGGLGFVFLVQDIDRLGLSAVFSPVQDYTFLTDRNFQWLNPVLAFMYPQRSTLFGFNLALLVMAVLWVALRQSLPGRAPFLAAGVVAGLSPLFHIHAFGTMVALGAFWAVISRRREWIWFFVPVVLLGVPAVLWMLGPGATRLTPQLGWLSGTDGHGDNVIWFWFKNMGLFIPLLVIAQLWPRLMPDGFALHFAPLWLWFLVPNIVVLQRWDWDNNKFFVFWALFGAVLVAAALVRMAERSREGLVLAAIATVILTLAGGLSLVRASNYSLSSALFADAPGVEAATWVRTHTEPDAVVLMAPDHNEPVADLGGRKLVVGYAGWLWTYGLNDWPAKTADAQIMLRGGESTQLLVRQYGVRYVVIGPHELNPTVGARPDYWERNADRVYANGTYTIYRVR